MKKVTFLVIALLFLSACSTSVNAPTDRSGNDQAQDEEQQTNSQAQNNESLDKSEAKEVLTDYKNTFMTLAEDSAQNGEVSEYDSKKELATHLTSIMSEKLADWYAETYFREENGELFIKAMDAPTWLQTDQPFTVTKANSEQQYKVVQERDNELLGHVNMIYVLALDHNDWIVKDIQTENLNQSAAPSATPSEETITEKKAIRTVKQKLQINEESNTIVEVDHINEKGNYVVHVYDVVDHENGSHTATVGWYTVNADNGKVNKMM